MCGRVILGDFETRVRENVWLEGVCVWMFICALEVYRHNPGAFRLRSHGLNESFHEHQPCREE